ncbi:MAG: ABC transporter substrate-binding protein [Chloroflexi bacterium]|nr:ABC transporter substrate-binding protein [Chloroflexota bacterium]
MRKKFVWLVVSCLMVLSLVLASCAPASTTPTTPTTPTAPTTPAAPSSPKTPALPTVPAAPTSETPKYGGIFTFSRQGGWASAFDPAFRAGRTTVNIAFSLGSDNLMTGDWAKGPAGTGEADFFTYTPLLNLQAPALAESWEVPDKETIIYHLRKGVHYALNPNSEASRLVGGRELTADDVVFTIKRNYDTPGAFFQARMTPPEFPVSVTAPDKYTVLIKGNPEGLQGLFEATYSYLAPYPPEVVKKYGDLSNWKNHVGTGPFMLVDYVEGSTATFIRNPNYWMKDPIGPGKGNQLPYLDGVKHLDIIDISTRRAALRTAKVDHQDKIPFEDAGLLMKTSPQLKYRSEPTPTPLAVFMRTDKPEQPWHDVRVRRALQMALDMQTIKDSYFKGSADLLSYPAGNFPMYKAHQTPLNEQSAIVQEMFSYKPEKAKQLLADAGFPKGFKMNVITLAENVDLLSVVKDYWAKIGVTLEIEVKERGVFASIETNRTHKEGMFKNSSITTPYAWHDYQPMDPANSSMIDDPVLNKAHAEFKSFYVFDEPKAAAIVKEAYKYVLEQAYVTSLPGPWTYSMWWPWVKNYHGEWIVGYTLTNNFPTYIWIDQSLKKSMGF